jgi:hypothetical protein
MHTLLPAVRSGKHWRQYVQPTRGLEAPRHASFKAHGSCVAVGQECRWPGVDASHPSTAPIAITEKNLNSTHQKIESRGLIWTTRTSCQQHNVLRTTNIRTILMILLIWKAYIIAAIYFLSTRKIATRRMNGAIDAPSARVPKKSGFPNNRQYVCMDYILFFLLSTFFLSLSLHLFKCFFFAFIDRLKT